MDEVFTFYRKTVVGSKNIGSFRFDSLMKFETKTDFYNMFFNAHSETVLFSGFFFIKDITMYLFTMYLLRNSNFGFSYVLHGIR